MRQLIVLALLLFKSTCFAGFSVCVPVTINHLKVPNTNQTNFTIPICANGDSGKYCDSTANSNLAATSFKTVANGGKATSASGFDINWFSDSGCTASLPFYFVAATYSATTGYGIWYVQKTLLTASDVTIYAGVGNASVTTNQSTNAWASTFKVVWPFTGAVDNTGPVIASIGVDATGNGYDLSAGASPNRISKAGVVDANGVNLYSIGGNGVQASVSSQTLAAGLPTGSADRTLIFYMSQPSVGGGNGYSFAYGTPGPPNHLLFAVRWNGTGSPGCTTCCGTGNAQSKAQWQSIGWGDDTNSTLGYCMNQGDGAGIWTAHQLAVVLSSSGTVIDMYGDGVLDTHSTGHAFNTTIGGTATHLTWNAVGDCTPNSNCFSGSINAAFIYGKIADSALSADYIATENNAVSSPQTFLTFGSPIPLGASPRRVVSFQ